MVIASSKYGPMSPRGDTRNPSSIRFKNCIHCRLPTISYIPKMEKKTTQTHTQDDCSLKSLLRTFTLPWAHRIWMYYYYNDFNNDTEEPTQN